MRERRRHAPLLVLAALAVGAAPATELDDMLNASPTMPFAEEFDCVNAFDLFASFAMVRCAVAPLAADDITSISRALARLRTLGIIEAASAPDVDVRFCPLLNGTGLVPAPHRMLLDDGLRAMSTDGLAEVIAHEFAHIEQFETLGPSEFKCAYVRAMSACGGCQDRAHPLEREAYEAQDRARARLARHPAPQEPSAESASP